MSKKQKRVLYRLILAAVLLVAASLLPVTGVWKFLCFLVPYFVIGYDVLLGALHGIVNGQIFDENFLMAIATVGAMGVGDYKESVAVLLFYQLGELFQSFAVGKSRQSITQLMDIHPEYANVTDENGQLAQVDPEEVEVGTEITVLPGERIPIDGVILTGTSTLNTSALTGESLPRSAAPGDAGSPLPRAFAAFSAAWSNAGCSSWSSCLGSTLSRASSVVIRPSSTISTAILRAAFAVLLPFLV